MYNAFNSAKRDEAKRKAYAEALEAARISTKSADDLNLHNLRGPDTGGIQALTNLPVIEGGLLHAYSVGQKGKKKDKPPEENRPGDWMCECQNYNFAWRKNCNACGKKKPFSKAEEDAMREIKQVFYDLAHEKRNAYECMAEFKAFKSSHEDLFDHDTKELIWKTAYYISTAVSSLNKSELILMTELATVLKLMEK